MKPERGFLSDPYFPHMLLESGAYSTWEFIQYLLEDYSRRNLATESDRHLAISGLEERIAHALKCDSRYGIFERYLHRTLLWQPSDYERVQIPYDYHVPSWSWMACSGCIKFMTITLGEAGWIGDHHLHFDKERECDHAITASLGKLRDCKMRFDEKEKNNTVMDVTGTVRGWIQYDVGGDKDRHVKHCVVVGRETKSDVSVAKYYILVVRPTSVDGEYTRIGVGQIQTGFVVRQRKSIRLV